MRLVQLNASLVALMSHGPSALTFLRSLGQGSVGRLQILLGLIAGNSVALWSDRICVGLARTKNFLANGIINFFPYGDSGS